MKINDILTEITNGENQYCEFKQRISNPESIAGEIVAFANSNEGRLYIGVDDNGAIIGLADSEITFQKLTNICRDRCIPPVSPIIEQHAIDNHDIIVLTVKPEFNRQKPYRTAGGRFYIRVEEDKKDATGRELIRIAQAAGELHYDETPLFGTSLHDISIPAFSAYHERQFGITLDEQLAQSGLDISNILQNLRLVHNVDNTLVLSIAALLIFGKNPQQFMPHSRISAVAFAGDHEDSDILDRHEITGRLVNIIKDTKVFLDRNIRKPAREHGFYREDILLYERKALGEAIVNAIAHRDYSLSGAQIRLFIFQDHIEVRSPGGLPNSITLDNIKFGVHAERNRAIATLLTQLGYMSAIGTGIPRLIIRLSRLLSRHEPEFILIGEELRVRIWARPFYSKELK